FPLAVRLLTRASHSWPSLVHFHQAGKSVPGDTSVGVKWLRSGCHSAATCGYVSARLLPGRGFRGLGAVFLLIGFLSRLHNCPPPCGRNRGDPAGTTGAVAR